VNEFRRDDEWQRQIRNAVLAPGFYGSYAVDGRYVLIDKGRLAKQLQRQAVDTILQGKDGNVVSIEEKIVRWVGRPYTAFALETISCTVPNREAMGWMSYGEADYLLYCFVTGGGGLDCHLIAFQALQAWFWPREKEFPKFQMTKTLNKTAGRVVPIVAVYQAVPAWRRQVEGSMMPQFQSSGV
jgi:hypothetical protein